MKDFITSLDKGFESRVRLGIMSILVVNDSVDFNTLKEQLNISDGNIASHITALEKLNYLEVKKGLSLWRAALRPFVLNLKLIRRFTDLAHNGDHIVIC